MTYQVRPVGVEEQEAWAEAVEMFRGATHHRHGEFLDDPATVAFLAREGTEILGWAWGYRQHRPDGSSMLLLYEIEVTGSRRREGIGRALLEAFLDVGRREGHQKMWLITGKDNDAANSLYESAGGGRSTKDDVGYWWPLR